MPVPIHPGCSNKINNEGFLGEGLKGREGEEIEGGRFIFFSVPIHRVYNALTAGHAPLGSSLGARSTA